MRTMLVNRPLCTLVVVVLDPDVHLYGVDLCSLLFDVVAANDDVEARLFHLQSVDDRLGII